MASVAATSACATRVTCLVMHKSVATTSSSAAARVSGISGLPLPVLKTRRSRRVTCSAAEEKKEAVQGLPTLATASGASFAAFAAANPSAAFALVDERLSTEGTGLSLGLSNSTLGWIILGVTTLIWSLYFVYSSGLSEGDDDSGLSL